MLSVVGSRGNIGVNSRVNADRDPGKDTVTDGVTKEDVLHEGVDGVSLLGENAVVSVGGEILGVGAVGRSLLNLGDEILVEEKLTDVGRRGRVQAGKGVVLQDSSLVGGVGQDYQIVRDVWMTDN